MANTTDPVPIIVCGKNPAVGSIVTEQLGSTYKQVAFISSVEQGKEEIPALLREQKASAVTLGGGYDDAAFDELKSAMPDLVDAVPWLRADVSKRNPADYKREEYAVLTGKACKAKLDELFSGGTKVQGGVHWF